MIKTMRTKIILLSVFLSLTITLVADNNEPGIVSPNPDVVWITHPDYEPTEFGVYLFRKNFHLETLPAGFPVMITADSRYVLYVNGKDVLSGPAKSDLQHWMYDSIDLVPYLKAGKNVIAIQVYHFGAENKPVALISAKAGLMIKGNSFISSIVDSDSSYKVTRNQAISQINMPWWEWNHGWYAIGPNDSIDAEKFPWGWQNKNFDDANWKAARAYNKSEVVWTLVPRNIPLLSRKKERLHKIRKIEEITSTGEFIHENEETV
ncbi:MAG: hypothetical protein ACOCUL_02935, partial [Bacteroidota bacterium]